MPNLTLIPGTLADPNCWTTPQSLYNEMFQRGVAVQSTTLTGVLLQDTEPSASDRDKVWARTSGGAPVTPFLWAWSTAVGFWVAKHPIAAGTLWAYPYTGSVASIATLDGGAVGAVGAVSGPFWEAVTSLAAKMPIGAGTLPSGTVLAVGDTGGEEKHTLLQTEMPSLWGNIKAVLRGWRITPSETLAPTWLAPAGSAGTTQTNPATETGTFSFENTGGDQPMNNLPPYTALTFLRRTARIYLTTPIA